MNNLRRVLFVVVSTFILISTNTSEAEATEVKKAPEAGQLVSAVKFEPVACVSDLKTNRTFRDLYLNARDTIQWRNWWPNMTTVINTCLTAAIKRRYTYFGIEFYGECWGDAQGPERYLFHGRSAQCESGVGKGNSLKVYKITEAPDLCVVGGTLYQHGEKVHTENPCKRCLCKQGNQVSCISPECPRLPSYCEKKELPPGRCCPICACFHNGQELGNEVTWFVKIHSMGRSCAECRCISGSAKCHLYWCPVCLYSVRQPNSCCPKCVTPPILKPINPSQLLNSFARSYKPSLQEKERPIN